MKVWIKGGVYNGVPISVGDPVTESNMSNRRLSAIIDDPDWTKVLTPKEIAEHEQKIKDSRKPQKDKGGED